MITRLLEADETTTAFDFHDPTGATTPSGVITEVEGDGFDEGTVDTGIEMFEADLPGGVRVFDRDGLSLIGWNEFLSAPTMAALEVGVNEMLRLLRDPPGPLLLQKDGGTALYADILGAPTLAPMLRGQTRGLFLVNTQKYVIDYPVELVRQPGFRLQTLTAGASGTYLNYLDNPTLLIDADLNGQPDGWTAGSGTHSIVAAQEAYQNSHTAVADLLSQTYASGISGGTYIFSAWVRRLSGSGQAILRVDNGSGAGVVDSSAITSSTWQRYSVQKTLSANEPVRVIFRQSFASGTSVFEFSRAQLQLNTPLAPFRANERTVRIDPTVV
jgi:hypothetical protein